MTTLIYPAPATSWRPADLLDRIDGHLAYGDFDSIVRDGTTFVRATRDGEVTQLLMGLLAQEDRPVDSMRLAGAFAECSTQNDRRDGYHFVYRAALRIAIEARHRDMTKGNAAIRELAACTDPNGLRLQTAWEQSTFYHLLDWQKTGKRPILCDMHCRIAEAPRPPQSGTAPAWLIKTWREIAGKTSDGELIDIDMLSQSPCTNADALAGHVQPLKVPYASARKPKIDQPRKRAKWKPREDYAARAIVLRPQT